ncbi:SDR family NAD(P)-dependent oxidoreductase [Paenarthrobacter sp. NPDC058040]|uniref:SDR family NAD(P)-dependent oxidoreductase n=1 Tax=unclassified Paenarthrobacter TaxID=2634190 RepID=UPI0036D87658
MGDLEGKVAVITGAGGGIGRATCRLFTAHGAKVVAADLNLHDAEAAAEGLGSDAMAFALDVTDSGSWQDCLEEVDRRFGTVTALVNNAGVYLPGEMNETDAAAFEAMFRVNQLGPLLGVIATAPRMAAAGEGSIVNISSTGGLRPAPGALAYSTTKWGIRGLTQSAAVALAPSGVRVNTVIPGLIDTQMARRNNPEANAAVARKTPIPRLGQAVEIAEAILFLCSERSSFIVGTELIVDGGLALT